MDFSDGLFSEAFAVSFRECNIYNIIVFSTVFSNITAFSPTEINKKVRLTWGQIT